MAHVEQGFVKADSRNMPQVKYDMIVDYCFEKANFLSPESRGAKFMRSARESYGDAAVGYVQVKRSGQSVICKAKLTPKDKVHAKGYNVTVQVNEGTSEILEAKCLDCAASQGGCKHAIAFLFWLHRRTEEKSVTEVTCYWKKSELSKVGTQKKFMKLSELTTVEVERSADSDCVASKFLEENQDKNSTCTYLLLHKSPMFATVSIHQLICKFVEEDAKSASPESFIQFCSKKMQKCQCIDAAEFTKGQSDNVMWYELRYGRITASKLHEASRCKTSGGSLVKRVFGATKFIPTEAMTRGLQLEDQVIKEVEKLLRVSSKKCGLVLDPKFPIFGASPDGLTDTAVIEVKCPKTTVENFIKNDKVVEKYEAQMQLQMKMCEKLHAVFAVADPQFEQNKIVHLRHIDYNAELCDKLILILEAIQFWKDYIYPVLPRP